MKKRLVFHHGIELLGAPDYITRVRAALSLLARRAPRDLAMVRKYVGRIEDYKVSGMAAWEHPPTFYLSRKTAFTSLTWCASCIVHDALHAKLYLDNAKGGRYPKRSLYSGRKVELLCIERQLRVSRRIGAPELDLKHLASLDGRHNDEPGQW